MRQVTVTTSIGSGDSKFEYPVTINQIESTDEYADICREDGTDPEEVLTGIVNSAWLQNAMQIPKGKVREALEKHGTDSEEVEAAVAEAQKYALEYRLGAPRGVRSGKMTKTEAREMGADIQSFGDEAQEELQAFYAELRERYGKS